MAKFVVWPSEVDSRLSRKYGRTVGRNLAIEAPSLSEISEAARSLGMKVEVEPDKLNPRLCGLGEEYYVRGMLRIEGRDGKGESLRNICLRIAETRRTSSKRTKSKKHRSKRKKRH